MPVKMELLDGLVPIKIYTDEVEASAMNQLKKLSQLSVIDPYVAIMPDVHTGIGSTIGSVIPTKDAIIPSAVGVDIGCGMEAVRLSTKASELPDDLKSIRSAIESAIPVGFERHSLKNAPIKASIQLEKGFKQIVQNAPDLSKKVRKINETWVRQLGTLGGGNHFIEICIDEQNFVWVMLHSGSRGIGNAIGRYFIALAKKEIAKSDVVLPDQNLAYFMEGSRGFKDYLFAVKWAQRYALINRQEMMRLIIHELKKFLPPFKFMLEPINCHHNYVNEEIHFGKKLYITRKGAIRARLGEFGIIPSSMGSSSYIVKGKGNPESFESCSHGAGRRMSRTQAKRSFTKEDLESQTIGVECRKDKHVIDEIPAAYKNIEKVMENQSDLIDIAFVLKQCICVKG